MNTAETRISLPFAARNLLIAAGGAKCHRLAVFGASGSMDGDGTRVDEVASGWLREASWSGAVAFGIKKDPADARSVRSIVRRF